MAKVAANVTRTYLDQYDLSGQMNGVNLDINQVTPIVTCLSDAGPRRVAAEYDHKHSHSGFFDSGLQSVGADRWDAVAFALLQDDDDHYLTNLWEGATAGKIAYDSIIKLDGQPRKASSGQAHLLELSGQGANGIARGTVLYSATATAAADGTGYNQGVTIAGEIYQAVIRVVSGLFTQIVVAIQESSDNASGDAYATISGMTHTFETDNTAAVIRLTTAAATEAWKRLKITTFTGTTAVILATGGKVQGS